jgi:hypothetical protein
VTHLRKNEPADRRDRTSPAPSIRPPVTGPTNQLLASRTFAPDGGTRDVDDDVRIGGDGNAVIGGEETGSHRQRRTARGWGRAAGTAQGRALPSLVMPARPATGHRVHRRHPAPGRPGRDRRVVVVVRHDHRVDPQGKPLDPAGDGTVRTGRGGSTTGGGRYPPPRPVDRPTTSMSSAPGLLVAEGSASGWGTSGSGDRGLKTGSADGSTVRAQPPGRPWAMALNDHRGRHDHRAWREDHDMGSTDPSGPPPLEGPEEHHPLDEVVSGKSTALLHRGGCRWSVGRTHRTLTAKGGRTWQ